MTTTSGSLPNLTYVLITPAWNEASLIEQTIQSVVRQTRKPLKWIIVSDGSVDGTDEIVKRWAAQHSWIELVRRPERAERHFAGKVRAFADGYSRVKDLAFDIIGNLDADITLDDPEYFAFLVGKFVENPELGVGGTPSGREMSSIITSSPALNMFPEHANYFAGSASKISVVMCL